MRSTTYLSNLFIGSTNLIPSTSSLESHPQQLSFAPQGALWPAWGFFLSRRPSLKNFSCFSRTLCIDFFDCF
nr:MAG TPA: hypothetical protein [Caudoviricetes sp.]